ncbi:MAG: putative sensor histidine kinase [Edafosvirus sp.]|uniref:Putative sensor histidine kinase n=1 Tax=Edafosvirus sp. TaxID=2487765 RepID=A0A3G4ZV51_9VIRU|nr:MAG: putative sensor histidine kinase [Edafosvirus sp.]
MTMSIKNTDQGSINIFVSLLENNISPFEYIKSKVPKYNIVFKIKDTSNGLTSNDVKAIESILRIKEHDIKKYYNHEFSLIISKYLCNLMSGNIWLDNEQGFGTIYYFNLLCSSPSS